MTGELNRRQGERAGFAAPLACASFRAWESGHVPSAVVPSRALLRNARPSVCHWGSPPAFVCHEDLEQRVNTPTHHGRAPGNYNLLYHITVTPLERKKKVNSPADISRKILRWLTHEASCVCVQGRGTRVHGEYRPAMLHNRTGFSVPLDLWLHNSAFQSWRKISTFMPSLYVLVAHTNKFCVKTVFVKSQKYNLFMH